MGPLRTQSRISRDLGGPFMCSTIHWSLQIGFLTFFAKSSLKINSVRIREGNKSGPGQLPKTIQTYHTISGRVSKLKAVINIEIFQEENLE